MSVLLVEKNDAGIQAAVTREGALYAFENAAQAFAVTEGQIYRGVVDRAVKGLGAVFIRLPGGAFGFLPVPRELKPPASGENVTVQVRRPPTSSKKAMLSRDISLPGTYLVYLPFGHGVRVSARVADEAERAALREAGGRLGCDAGGVILRSAARQADDAALRSELSALIGRWSKINAPGSAPALLWNGDDPITRLLREENGRLEYVLTNAPEALPADLPCPVRTSPHPFMLQSISAKLEKSLRRTVLLKSGASLVIDPCEAMTVIDVNSGMASGGKCIGETAEKVNAEAAREIARLLRLRGIGGMIVVDFIDMINEDANARLLKVMRESLAGDPVKTVVHDITALGLMELTRHRERTPLPPVQDIPCPYCGGTGISDTGIKEDDAHA